MDILVLSVNDTFFSFRRICDCHVKYKRNRHDTLNIEIKNVIWTNKLEDCFKGQIDFTDSYNDSNSTLIQTSVSTVFTIQYRRLLVSTGIDYFHLKRNRMIDLLVLHPGKELQNLNIH